MTTMDTSKVNGTGSAVDDHGPNNFPSTTWTVKRPRNEGNRSTMIDGGRRTSPSRGPANENNYVDNNNNNNNTAVAHSQTWAQSSSSPSEMMVPYSGFENGGIVQWGDDDNASIYSPSPKRMKWSIISQRDEPEENVKYAVDGRRRMRLFDAETAANLTSSTTFTAFRMPFSSPSAVSCSSSPDRTGISTDHNFGVNGNDDDDTQMAAVKLEDGGPSETNDTKNIKDKNASSSSSSSPLEWWKQPQPKQDEASRQHSVESEFDQNSPSFSASVVALTLLQCHICQQSFPKAPTRSVKNVMKPNALLQYFSYKNTKSANGSNDSNGGSVSASTAKHTPARVVSTVSSPNDNPDTCHRCSRSCCKDCRSNCMSCQEVVCGFCGIQSNIGRNSVGGGGEDHSITMMDCDDDNNNDDVAGGDGQRRGNGRSGCISSDNDDGMMCWDCASRCH